ncbi:MAG: SusC/RagA family TonB-linked outer membrane protein, partial [Candidatus Scalindua sp.]
NVSLLQAFTELEKNTGYEFTYDRKVIKSELRVDLVGENLKVYDYLLTLSKEGNLYFKQYNNNISVSRNKSNNFKPPVSVIVQTREVSGRVISAEDNEGLPGVNVIIKGTNQGSVTDVEGNYKLEVPGEATILVFSSVGYVRKEISVGTQSIINISLNEDVTALEEIVVIGYGTQKKVNLTGSVATVGGAELNKRTTPNFSNLLQGKISGLQVTQSGGTPGDDGAKMRIRGLGTFSSTGSGPLVLIDGIQGNMSDLDPNNVESVSVLKDAASAAIYGARAANGVILITTKRGKIQPVSVEYHVTFESQKASVLPDLLTNSADYMMFFNEANVRYGREQYFPQSDIDAFRNNMNDPVNYPNFDWVDYMFRTSFVQNHHISVRGGNEKTKFNLAAGYLDQPGILPGFEFKKFNVSASIDTKINDWISIGGIMQATKRYNTKDVQSNYNAAYFVMHAYGPAPNYTPTMTLPDGSTGYVARYSKEISEWTVRNPMAILAQGSNTTDRYNTRTQLYADVKLTKDLTWHTKGAVNFDHSFNKNHEHAVDNFYFKDGSYAHNGAVWHLGVRDEMNTALLTTLYSTLNYTKVINSDHDFNILVGYNQESADYRRIRARRKYFPTNSLSELAAGSSLEQFGDGTASEWAIQSFFGRFAYAFKERYLFEANARYDGTSRIAPDTRWGLFPSLSAAWRISEESFMENLSWIDNLKLRGSWGQLGNQNVGTYPYQDVLSTTQYAFGGQEAGVQLTRLVDKTLQWETTTITDFGFDASFNNGLITITVDWYDKLTEDILYSVPVPASVGLSAPIVNGGSMKNIGWDFELGHNNKIGEVTYNVNFNLSTYKNEVISLLRPSYGKTTKQEGLPYNSWYLTEMIGIFQNQGEIDNGPVHRYNPKPGDLKFKDQNGDMVIDDDDRVVVDGAFPKFYYGGSLNLSWRNFDFSTFFQGVEGLKTHTAAWGLTPFMQGSPPTMDLVNNRWTGDGSTNTHPAMYRGGYKPVDGTNSTYYLHDNSYVRLKNLRIGYNLPAATTQKIGIKEAQVYFSGDNLLTFSQYPGGDPERGDAAANRFSVFPQLKTLALGIKVKL